MPNIYAATNLGSIVLDVTLDDITISRNTINSGGEINVSIGSTSGDVCNFNSDVNLNNRFLLNNQFSLGKQVSIGPTALPNAAAGTGWTVSDPANISADYPYYTCRSVTAGRVGTLYVGALLEIGIPNYNQFQVMTVFNNCRHATISPNTVRGTLTVATNGTNVIMPKGNTNNGFVLDYEGWASLMNTGGTWVILCHYRAYSDRDEIPFLGQPAPTGVWI